jgi:hypothetical protein
MIGALWNSYWLVPLYAVLMTATVLLGRLLSRKEEQNMGTPRQFRVGPFERSVGTIMAFLLGFCFAISGGDLRETQATLHRESDAITEAYRYSQLFSETDRQWLQDNLRAYVDLLIRGDAHSTNGPEAETVGREIRSEQEKRWEGLAARRSVATERTAYDTCLRAVNQFIQSYDLRYYLNRRRLPDVMVLFILGATLLVGFLVGYTSESQGRQFAVMACLFVLFITATIYLIWEVDRPREGFITTNRQNLTDLAGRLRESSP